jgi:hypothetical protein
MYRSLILLSRLRFRGGLRKLKRAISSPKGALLAIFTVLFFGGSMAPAILASRTLPDDAAKAMNFRMFLHPAALLGLWVVTSLGARIKSPIAFSLPEVEFLFPGPFTRRQLMLYKLAIGALGGLGFAIMVPLFGSRLLAVWWPAAVVGFWWMVVFMQMLTVLLILAVDCFGQRLRTWRAPAAVTVAIAVAVSLWGAGLFEAEQGIGERLAALEASWAAQVVLSPFVVFSRLIAAETAMQFLGWGAAALALNAIVVVGILRLDGYFLEASLAASQRRYEWIQRAMRGGGVPAMGMRIKPRFSLPGFPRLWGAGPIAWRQTLQLWRGSGRLIFIAPALAGPIIAGSLAGRQSHASAPGMVADFALTFFVGFFVTTVLPLGLRIDLQHVDAIKSLPLSPSAIVWGSISAGILYTTVLQLVVVSALALGAGRWTTGTSLAVAFAAPLNLLLIGSDSILVILFPTVRQFAPGDVLIGMRMMLVYAAKMLFLAAMAAIAGFYVFVVYALWGDSRPALAATAWLALVVEGILTVWFGGLMFAKFDPSSHAPQSE